MSKIQIFVFLAVALLIGPLTARADLIFTLTPAEQNALRGAQALFSGTLTNTGPQELFLNSIDFNLADPHLTGDGFVFFNNVPISLQASGTTGDSYAGSLFGIALDNTTPFGDYFGAVTISGGADNLSFDELGTQYFKVTVAPSTAVPEMPSCRACLLLLLAGAAMLRRRVR